MLVGAALRQVNSMKGGPFTPEELASFAAVVSFVVGIFIFGSLFCFFIIYSNFVLICSFHLCI